MNSISALRQFISTIANFHVETMTQGEGLIKETGPKISIMCIFQGSKSMNSIRKGWIGWNNSLRNKGIIFKDRN